MSLGKSEQQRPALASPSRAAVEHGNEATGALSSELPQALTLKHGNPQGQQHHSLHDSMSHSHGVVKTSTPVSVRSVLQGRPGPTTKGRALLIKSLEVLLPPSLLSRISTSCWDLPRVQPALSRQYGIPTLQTSSRLPRNVTPGAPPQHRIRLTSR